MRSNSVAVDRAEALGARRDAARPEPLPKAAALEARRLYFAYGSNMDPIQLRERCPMAEVIGIARLDDYQWCITGRGVASVRPHLGGRVFGILVRLTSGDEARLDKHEGVAAGFYRREILPVHVENGASLQAMAYLSNDEGFGSPRAGYLERVLAGARHHGLPSGAIAEIEAWAQGDPNREACTVNVFVYGTLKRGHCNHAYIADGIFVGNAVTVHRYALHVQGLPRVDRNNPVSPIHGELYRVSPATLMELDRLEGHPHGYRRSMVPVDLGDGSRIRAWLYFHPNPSGPIETSGRFRSSPSDARSENP